MPCFPLSGVRIKSKNLPNKGQEARCVRALVNAVRRQGDNGIAAPSRPAQATKQDPVSETNKKAGCTGCVS